MASTELVYQQPQLFVSSPFFKTVTVLYLHLPIDVLLIASYPMVYWFYLWIRSSLDFPTSQKGKGERQFGIVIYVWPQYNINTGIVIVKKQQTKTEKNPDKTHTYDKKVEGQYYMKYPVAHRSL
jgi:hypothetical protein